MKEEEEAGDCKNGGWLNALIVLFILHDSFSQKQ